MKKLLCRLILLLIGALSGNVLIAQQAGPNMTFYFDYRIEYIYSTPGIPSGTIIVLYNSKDKYAGFTKITPFLEDDDLMVCFQDGSNILLTEVNNNKRAIIREASIPGRNLDKVEFDMDAAVFWDYVKSTGRQTDMAGYLVEEYKGVLDDYSERTVWLSKESFDARMLHTPFNTATSIFPLPLVEASYISPEQFLFGSEIRLEDGSRYSLNVTYLEYELNKVTVEDLEIYSGGGGNSQAERYDETRGLLREAKWETWQNFDKMDGLEYQPRTYEFDRELTFECIIPDEGSSKLEVFLHSKNPYVGFKSKAFKNGLEFVLAFKNGSLIAYYKDEENGKQEAIFIEAPGNQMHLDDPQLISWYDEEFKEFWIRSGKRLTIGGQVSDQFILDTTANNKEFLYLKKVEFDPRLIYMDHYQFVQDFPACFAFLGNISPYELVVKWESESAYGSPASTNLVQLKESNFKFSDEKITSFRRVKK